MKYGTLVRIQNIQQADEKFAELRKYGFTSCQLVYKPKEYQAEDARVIREVSEKYGIDISAQFCGYYDNDTVWDNYYGFRTAGLNVEPYGRDRLEYLKQAAAFAALAGIRDIVVHAGFIPNNPFAPEYASLLAAVRTLCEFCREKGLHVLLETGGESAVAMLRLITDTGADNLFVNLDPANMLMYGYANPVDALYTIGKYVRDIHGKDGIPPTSPRALGEEKPVGQGMVDFDRMFRKLKELGYDRCITIEREITGEEQLRDILAAKAYFEKLISEIYENDSQK